MGCAAGLHPLDSNEVRVVATELRTAPEQHERCRRGQQTLGPQACGESRHHCLTIRVERIANLSPAAEISVADIIRAVDGPLAAVRGERPEGVSYGGPAEPLQRVWIAVRKNLRDVVEHVSLADLAGGSLPENVNALADDPDAWTTR